MIISLFKFVCHYTLGICCLDLDVHDIIKKYVLFQGIGYLRLINQNVHPVLFPNKEARYTILAEYFVNIATSMTKCHSEGTNNAFVLALYHKLWEVIHLESDPHNSLFDESYFAKLIQFVGDNETIWIVARF